jgi:signal transduction histidine kinase
MVSFALLLRARLGVAQWEAYDSIFQILEDIARGNFSVRLDVQLKNGRRFSELSRKINYMAAGLSQLEEMRQEFISNVSHEIQSPLTSIRGFVQALRSDSLGAEEREHYLNIIETESNRLSSLSDNLLKLASLEARNMKFDSQPYRLDKQLRNLILASEPQWMEKQIDMQIFLDDIIITADEDLLSQVWINLIHNSIKFTPLGGKIRLDLHQSGSEIQFKISDSGIGIAAEDQKHIFERFYKADRSRERSQGGSGLGLSICQKIIAMHNGSINVQSNLGEGAIFTVSLPAE